MARDSRPPPLSFCLGRACAVSLPRLKAFDWRVDMKTASEQVPRMAVPCCLVQMTVCAAGRPIGRLLRAGRRPPSRHQVEDRAASTAGMAVVKDLTFEVNKVWRASAAAAVPLCGGGALTPHPWLHMCCAQDTLATMLDGLGKIRAQLESLVPA